MQAEFHARCRVGDLAGLQWLVSTGAVDISGHASALLEAACESGNVPTVLWLHQLGTSDRPHAFPAAVQTASKSGNLALVQWLLCLLPSDSKDVDETKARGFHAACCAGHLQVAQWIASGCPGILSDATKVRKVLEMATAFPSVVKWVVGAAACADLDTVVHAALKAVCLNGYLELAQWLANWKAATNDPVRQWGDRWLSLSCEGHLHLAKWIVQQEGAAITHQHFLKAVPHVGGRFPLPFVHWMHSMLEGDCDYHQHEDMMFRNSSVRAGVTLPFMQWLWSLGGVDIHAYEDRAFRNACTVGSLDAAKWLWSLGGVDIRAGGNDAFGNACAYGKADVAMWLYELDPGVVNGLNRTIIFGHACANGSLRFVKWLYGVMAVDIHDNDDHALRRARGKPEIGQWLLSLEPDWMYPWPHQALLEAWHWSPYRDLWIRAVVCTTTTLAAKCTT